MHIVIMPYDHQSYESPFLLLIITIGLGKKSYLVFVKTSYFTGPSLFMKCNFFFSWERQIFVSILNVV